MRKEWRTFLRVSGVFLVLTVALVVFVGCDNLLGDDDSGSGSGTVQAPTVGSVTLPGSPASTSHFSAAADFPNDVTLIKTKAEFMDLLEELMAYDDDDDYMYSMGSRFFGMGLVSKSNDDEDDPFFEWLDENFDINETDGRITVKGDVSESIVMKDLDPDFDSGAMTLNMDVDLTNTWNESASRFTATIDLASSATVDITTPWVSAPELRHLGGYATGAVNLKVNFVDDYDAGNISLGFGVSAKISAALSIAVDVSDPDDSSTEDLRGAHILITVDYSDSLPVSGSYDEFDQEMADTLAGRAGAKVSIKLHNDSGTQTAAFDLTPDDFGPEAQSAGLIMSLLR